MNIISQEKREKALMLFTMRRASIRYVAREVGISRETANALQKYSNKLDIIFAGRARINTGKSANGRVSYKYVHALRPNWKSHHDANSLLLLAHGSSSKLGVKLIVTKVKREIWASVKAQKDIPGFKFSP